jgi:hypothetical protein
MKGNQMELDGYCKNINIGFEYHGHQHFKFVRAFQKDKSDLKLRQKDDDLKRELCKKNGMVLIEVPYSIPHDKIGEFILRECNQRGIKVPNRNAKLNYLNFDIYSPDKLKYFQDFAEKNNAICLSSVYVNNKTPIKIKCCVCGTIWGIRPANLKSGKWCPKCARNKLESILNKKYDLRRKIALEKAKQIIDSHHAKLISKSINSKNTKLVIICDKGHTFETRYDHLLNGHFCKECAVRSNSDKQRGNIEEMNKIAESRGGKCLSTIYLNANHNLEWECIKGHRWKATPKNIKRGTWCQKCYWERRKHEP